jgi:hypothetical protein
VRTKVIGATLALSFLLFAGAAPAQAPQSAPAEKRSPLSQIARDLTTWLDHVAGSGAHHARVASSPPLPRPRPAEPAPMPVVSNGLPSEATPAAALPRKKIVAPVLIND